MRKITAPQILVFVLMFGSAATAALWSTCFLLPQTRLGSFYGIAFVGLALLLLYVYAILLYRLLIARRPIPHGDIAPSSKEEAAYHVYLLFFLILFYPVMRSGAMPVPLMRIFYLALGAKLGANTYSSGIIFDPSLVSAGANTIIGQSALLIPHAIEGERLSHAPISLGNNVTIGAGATVLGGCVIGDNAVVAIGAVVAKGSVIPSGEVWGGTPARKLR